MPTSIELRRQRGAIWEQMEALHKTAETEKRALTVEETSQWDAWAAEMDGLQTQVAREERREALGADMRSSAGLLAGRPAPETAGPDAPGMNDLIRQAAGRG